jgi:diguanylate cyclase (GGDEF)-like protein
MLLEAKLKLGFVLAIIVMAVTAIVPFGTAYWAHSLQQELREAQHIIESLASVQQQVQDAESNQRGFVISGNEEFLEPYYMALTQLAQARADLQRSLGGRQRAAEALQQLDQQVQRKTAWMAQTIAVRRSQGFEAVREMVTSTTGKKLMDDIRANVNAQIARENRRRDELRHELEYRTDVDAYMGLAATLVDMLLLAGLLYMLVRQVRERRATLQALQRSGEQLNAGLAAMERHNAEILLVGQMVRALESPMTLKECFDTLSIYCARLLPETSGLLYLFRNSRDLLELESRWGRPAAALETIGPNDCWGLRRGSVHKTLGEQDLVCRHYLDAGELPVGSLCVPLIAQGEVLGLACIQPPEGQLLAPRTETLAGTLCEQIALTLSNIRLREALRQQSIIDPLTGLFNRRYMDETLRREISRAHRKNLPLAVIVLDIDHFKKINDLHGHDAGDTVLRAFALHLRREVREGDVACRLGGEEFVLILAECGAETAVARMQALADAIRRAEVSHGGRPLGGVTASFGVAAFPQHGHDADGLLQTADRAMYLAKNSGRDRVVMAHEESPSAPGSHSR